MHTGAHKQAHARTEVLNVQTHLSTTQSHQASRLETSLSYKKGVEAYYLSVRFEFRFTDNCSVPALLRVIKLNGSKRCGNRFERLKLK